MNGQRRGSEHTLRTTLEVAAELRKEPRGHYLNATAAERPDAHTDPAQAIPGPGFGSRREPLRHRRSQPHHLRNYADLGPRKFLSSFSASIFGSWTAALGGYMWWWMLTSMPPEAFGQKNSFSSVMCIETLS